MGAVEGDAPPLPSAAHSPLALTVRPGVLHCATVSWHLLLYVLPSEPHTGAYSAVHATTPPEQSPAAAAPFSEVAPSRASASSSASERFIVLIMRKQKIRRLQQCGTRKPRKVLIFPM